MGKWAMLGTSHCERTDEQAALLRYRHRGGRRRCGELRRDGAVISHGSDDEGRKSDATVTH
jgi:hypothetical protein